MDIIIIMWNERSPNNSIYKMLKKKQAYLIYGVRNNYLLMTTVVWGQGSSNLNGA